jgi:GTP 3',8-cyclase
MRLDNFGIPWGKGPFRRTKRISFELSNICNLAQEHKRCPVHLKSETCVLPASVIDGVLETCRRHEFEGVFAFHLYNEPGVDPRLALFLERIKRVLPRARTFMLTNGWYLTQSLAEELVAHGLDYLVISAYTLAEWERLRQFKLSIPVQVNKQILDDRLTWYEQERLVPVSAGRPCYCPVYEICITCRGEVTLCPYDWQRRHVFGNLNNESLEDVLARPDIWRVYEGLSLGRRELDICLACKTARGEAYLSTTVIHARSCFKNRARPPWESTTGRGCLLKPMTLDASISTSAVANRHSTRLCQR